MRFLNFFACGLLTAAVAGQAFAAKPAAEPLNPLGKSMIPDADIVIVGHHLNARSDKPSAWKELLPEPVPDASAVWAQMAETSPALPKLLKDLLGLSDDLQTVAVDSLAFSVKLHSDRKALEAAERKDLPPTDALAFALRRPGLSIESVDADLQQLVGDCAAKSGARVDTVERQGAWRVLKGQSNVGFYGYRPIEDGLLVAIAESRQRAEASLSGKAPAPGDPRAIVFKPKGDKPSVRLCVADVADLFRRFSRPDDLAEIRQNAPLLLHVHALVATLASRDDDALVLSLAVKTDTDANAAELQKFLDGWKNMLGQMMIPMATQNPKSTLAAVVSAVKIKAKGKTVNMMLAITPAQAMKIRDEVQVFQQNQSLSVQPIR